MTRTRSGRGELTAAVIVTLGGVLALAAVSWWNLLQGDAGLSSADLWAALSGTADSTTSAILEGVRLPRLLAGVLVGSALGAAGVVFQTATRNPLAEPSTLAVTSGAWFTVVVAELAGWEVSGYFRGGAALVGGMLAAAVVLTVGSMGGGSPTRLVLTGTTVQLTLTALTGLLLLSDEQRASGLFFWGQGTLVQVDSTKGLQYLPVIFALTAVAVFVGPKLDLLRLDDDTARSLGTRPRRDRAGLMALGVGLSAAGVAVAGPLSFVGLAGPRVPLAAGVVRHRLLVPAAAVWGAVVVVGADAAVQSLRTSVGFSELPAGVATALIGAPLLLVLARRIGADGLASSVGSTMRARSTVRSPAPVFVAALLALLVVCLAGLLLGEVDIPLGDAIAALFGGGPELAGELIRQDRLPRVLTACLAGMCLGVSGAVVQAVGRNALAEPGLLGITGGAAVGAMVLLVVAPAVPAVLVPLAAFAGAVAALAVVVAAAWRGGLAPERLLLVGISVAAFTTALVSFLVVISGPAAATALLWLTGSTYARGMNDVAGLVLWPLVLLPLLWFGGRHMDLLALGDDLPRSLGLRLERTRLALIAGAVLLAAAAVSTVGAIGFIGLLAPHLARASTGNRHRWLVALSAVYGALLLVAADLVSRLVNPPGGVPSGLVVAVVGAPAFVVMLTWRERRAPSAARHRRILWWRRAVPRLDG